MGKRLGRVVLVLGLVGVLAVAGILVAVPELRWRADLVLLLIGGRIPDLTLGEGLSMLAPGSGFYLEPLASTRNPYYSIKNPLDGPESARAGEKVFASQCATCHGHAGVGDAAPSLATGSYATGDSDWAMFRTISQGIPEVGMPQLDLEDRQVWQLVSYLTEIRRAAQSRPPAAALAVAPVEDHRLLEDEATPDDWVGYSGGYSGQRFSQLDEVNRHNADRLQVKWVHQLSGDLSMVEASPIVNGSVMYITEPPNNVHALDAATGELLWSYSHRNAPNLKLCCGQVNRGVAVHGQTVYMGTLDAHLVALDAATGKLRWKKKLADHEQGFSITSAPLIVGDLAIVGYGGGDLGVRGFIDALSVEDGSRRWRFYSIPEPGQPGNETWSGDSWKRGGAATWLTGVYDPELDLVYWGIGNPGPDYQGDLRKGDNLYSNSVVALRPEDGELEWYFQFTPHDERDWDSNQMPALVDLDWQGEPRKAMLWPNRNGFYYVLDRTSGEFLRANAFVEQNWATGIDEQGRPIEDPATAVSTKGTATWPAVMGAINWHSPTYSPRTGLHYLPALIWGGMIYKHPIPADYKPGDPFLGGETHPIPGLDLYFSIRAVEPVSGDLVWSHDLPKRSEWWKTGGLVSTAGDVVFGADNTTLFVLDAADGRRLWDLQVGGRVNASPVTYAAGDRQMFAIAAGRSIVAVGLPD